MFLKVDADILEEYTASIFMAFFLIRSIKLLISVLMIHMIILVEKVFFEFGFLQVVTVIRMTVL
jgi:hypothetical protein